MKILALFLFMCAYGYVKNEIIYAGKGFWRNTTIYLIEEPVTWFAAAHAESFGCRFGKDIITRYNVMKSVAVHLTNIGYTGSQLVWLGSFKSNFDGNRYLSDTCNPENKLKVLNNDCGETMCVALNFTSFTFIYQDCMNLNSYICIEHEPSTVENRENVTVNIDTEMSDSLYINKNYNINSSTDCWAKCIHSFMCLASYFNHTDLSCDLFVDSTYENLNYSLRMEITENSTDQTELNWKSAGRVFFEFGTFPGNNRHLDNSSFNCFHLINKTSCGYFSTTSTTVSTTTQQTCACPAALFQNTSFPTTLESIKRELTLDKKSLSSAKRKLTSAEDSRPSSQAFGWMGALILGSVVVFLTISDVISISLYCKRLFFLHVLKKGKNLVLRR